MGFMTFNPALQYRASEVITINVNFRWQAGGNAVPGVPPMNGANDVPAQVACL